MMSLTWYHSIEDLDVTWLKLHTKRKVKRCSCIINTCKHDEKKRPVIAWISKHNFPEPTHQLHPIFCLLEHQEATLFIPKYFLIIFPSIDSSILPCVIIIIFIKPNISFWNSFLHIVHLINLPWSKQD